MIILRTIAVLVVGFLLGLALGIGFNSIVVGVIAGAAFTGLFDYIFNNVKRKKDK